jgi:hypothetical protein
MISFFSHRPQPHDRNPRISQHPNGEKSWGITKLYNKYFYESASQLAKLDTLTLQAYGFNPTDDLLEVLLALNLELAEKERNGVALTSGQSETIVGPWAPDKPPKS